MKQLLIASLALLTASLASTVFAAGQAIVLFAQPGTIIVDANGVSRPAKRGDVVQTEERLSTPPGAISQLKLLDGSLLGLRPDSEMKIALTPATSDKDLQLVSLNKGAVHVLGAELMDAKNTSRFVLQSGKATLRTKGADLESSVTTRSAGTEPASAPSPGSSNRMLVGSGSIESGGKVVPLVPRETFFVDDATDAGPKNVELAELSLLAPTISYNKVVLTMPKPQPKTPVCRNVRQAVICT